MQVPLQLTFRDISHLDFVEKRIYDKVEKLKKYSEKIIFCRVIVTAPPRQHHKGKIYHVSIDIRLPGKKIVVARDPGNPSHDNGYIAIRDAFEAARRQLKKLVRQKRNRYQRTPKTTIPEIL